MNIQSIDYVVLVTGYLVACLHLYMDILGIRHEVYSGRHSLLLGNQKINIHTRPGQFQPAARCPDTGNLDFCLVADDDIADIIQTLQEKGVSCVAGPVARYGAWRQMDSVYVYDPDGNLVEIAVYREHG